LSLEYHVQLLSKYDVELSLSILRCVGASDAGQWVFEALVCDNGAPVLLCLIVQYHHVPLRGRLWCQEITARNSQCVDTCLLGIQFEILTSQRIVGLVCSRSKCVMFNCRGLSYGALTQVRQNNSSSRHWCVILVFRCGHLLLRIIIMCL
jgi:hypothetical protein